MASSWVTRSGYVAYPLMWEGGDVLSPKFMVVFLVVFVTVYLALSLLIAGSVNWGGVLGGTLGVLLAAGVIYLRARRKDSTSLEEEPEQDA